MKLNIFQRQHYDVDQLLKNIAHKSPDLVVEFLMKRLEYARDNDVRSKDYAPLPYLDFHENIFDAASFQASKQYMQNVMDLAINPAGLDIFWLPKLFKFLTNNFSEEALVVLTEWIKVGGEKNIVAISFLLREANQDFLFSQYEFIGKLLEAAAVILSDCLEKVKSNLFGIAVSEGSTRSHGQPSQKSINLRDKGKEISQKFTTDRLGYRFYQEISEYGEAEIRRELAMDQEMEYE